MITPNICGHGQLFAFSALDGNAFMGDDFSGILCADKIVDDIGLRLAKSRRFAAVARLHSACGR